ncbi:MAG TPA: hypothetical protein VL326_00365 [Kofleriaceae bacterium]|nr:hypothetical protein [Kofleriaceae bacterium]
MRWVACAWLLVVGCFDPPTGPPYKVRLLSAEPPVVAVHGGELVTIRYSGDALSNLGIAVDGVIIQPDSFDPIGRTFTFVTPVHDRGPVALALYNTDRGRQIAFNDDLLSYEVMPGKPVLALSSFAAQSLAWRLHPELSRECARGGQVYLENTGDLPLTLSSVHSSNADFTFTAPPSECSGLPYGSYCILDLCFTSPIQGSPSATLTASTNSGDANLNVWANVTFPIPGLDPTFHGGGVVYDANHDEYGGVGIVGPNGLVTWAGTRLIAIDLAGTETQHDVATFVSGLPANQIVAIRVAPSGGYYVLVKNSGQPQYAAILHVNDALVPDVGIDLPADASNPYYDLQVQTGGRLLAIGLRSVVALLPSGAYDTTYGPSGQSFFPSNYANHNVLDSQGRLYVTTATGTVRLGTNGSIDTSFSYPINPTSITIDAADHVFVLVGTRVAQLSPTGTETVKVSNAPFANDLDVDGSGRFYLVSNAIVQRYTNGTLEGAVGYDDTSSVTCPLSGGCYLLGVGVLAQKPFSTGAPDYMEKYVLRLAN